MKEPPYPQGTRVVFIGFGEPDPYSNLKPGTEGTVRFMDSLGTVFVNWDDGSQLGMIVELEPGRKPDRIARVT